MKNRLFHTVAIVSSLLIPAGAAQAQYYGYSSTAAEGFLHGSADLTRACGQFNLYSSQAALYSSQAAIYQQEAYRRALDNRQKHLETYFELKRTNESRRAERRPRQSTPEEISRRNQERLPQRLTASQFESASGAICWHGVLENDEFAPGRAELARLFAERQTGDSGAGTQNSRDISLGTVEDLKRQLARDAKRISIDEYTPARKFLDSLAYEARFSPSSPDEALVRK